MKITIELDDIRSIIERSGLVPQGYRIERVEQGAYSKEIDIHCERIEVTPPLTLDRITDGGVGIFSPPQRPCVIDSKD